MNNKPSVCELVIENYQRTLGREFSSYANGDSCVLVSPFLRSDGESIEIEAEPYGDGSLRLSDMGESIAFLFVNGLTVSRGILDSARKICRRYSVDITRGELVAHAANVDDFGTRLHELIQASILVSDMIQRRRPSEVVQFPEVVEGFLVANRVVYDLDAPVRGSVQEHRVRFLIGRDSSPVVIQPITAASEGAAFSWAERWAYRFGDMRDGDNRITTLAVLDDRGTRAELWTPRTITPLRSRSNVIMWSESQQLLAFLPAA